MWMCVTFSLTDHSILDVASVVVAVLEGSLSSNVAVTKAGLRAIGNLADNDDDNRRLLGCAGACEGEKLLLVCVIISVLTHPLVFMRLFDFNDYTQLLCQCYGGHRPA